MKQMKVPRWLSNGQMRNITPVLSAELLLMVFINHWSDNWSPGFLGYLKHHRCFTVLSSALCFVFSFYRKLVVIIPMFQFLWLHVSQHLQLVLDLLVFWEYPSQPSALFPHGTVI